MFGVPDKPESVVTSGTGLLFPSRIQVRTRERARENFPVRNGKTELRITPDGVNFTHIA